MLLSVNLLQMFKYQLMDENMNRGKKRMKKKIIGIFACMLLFSIAVLPVTSNPVSESENIDACIRETKVRAFYFLKIDFCEKERQFG